MLNLFVWLIVYNFILWQIHMQLAQAHEITAEESEILVICL